MLRKNSYHAAEGCGDAEELADMWILRSLYGQVKYSYDKSEMKYWKDSQELVCST